MIGIIFIGDLKYCPYLEKYLDIICKTGLEYEVLFWHRSNVIPNYPANYKYYNKNSPLNASLAKKLFDFYGFRSWLLRKLENRNYEKLIVLSTLSGMLIFDRLIMQYKKKYWFDVRDYSFEHLKLFAFIEELLIKGSYLTAISSSGFKEFLPKGYQYQIVHNLSSKELGNRLFLKRQETNSPFRIVFNGTIRYFNYQAKIVDKLADDNRFLLLYHGDGPDLEKFRNYVLSKKIQNVLFTGSYNNKNKADLL